MDIHPWYFSSSSFFAEGTKLISNRGCPYMRHFIRTILHDTRLSRRGEMVKKYIPIPPIYGEMYTLTPLFAGSKKTNAHTSRPGSKRTKAARPVNVASLSETFSTASKTTNSSSEDSCTSDSSFPVRYVFCCNFSCPHPKSSLEMFLGSFYSSYVSRSSLIFLEREILTLKLLSLWLRLFCPWYY